MGSHSQLMEIEEGSYRRMKEMQDLHSEEEVKVAKPVVDKDSYKELKKKLSKRKTGNSTISFQNLKMSINKLDYQTINDISDEDLEENKDRKKSDEDTSAGVNIVSRAFRMNSPEWAYISMGVFGCIINGMLWPIFALVFSNLLAGYLNNDQNQVNEWSLIFVGLAVASAIGQITSLYGMGVAGEKLTRRIRRMCFDKLVRQPVYWFDKSENSVGVLTTRLSSDATLVRGLTADVSNIFLSQSITLITGLVIAFTACPKLAAVVLACVPSLGIGAWIQMKLMSGFMEDGVKIYEEAGKVAAEAVDNIKTVNALNCGYYFLQKYANLLTKPKRTNFMKAQVAAILFGFSEFATFGIWALAFWYGGKLVTAGECTFTEMMKAISAIIFGAMTMGQVAAFTPDVAGGRVAALKVFAYLDLKSEINIDVQSGEAPPDVNVTGNVAFNDIGFVYPTRPEAQVLTSMCSQIDNGKTLALVGESGCGKSTLLSLVEQFYKPAHGYVSVDGRPITDYNLKYIRSQIGVVSQEPDLFNKTVRENIAYGFGKTEGVIVTDEQIEWAAKKANAHDFIIQLPQGYDSLVGERGSLLSGGQKQRVAIARALVRDPKILLLDEATSALDSDSERVVQNALDAARESRTTIVIAHRLSTIVKADKICVIGNGKVLEEGQHGDLFNKKGAYYNLFVAQC
eukprot:Pgem_evm1s12745